MIKTSEYELAKLREHPKIRVLDQAPAMNYVLERLRDEFTPPLDFERELELAGTLSAYEVSKELGCGETWVRTPTGEFIEDHACEPKGVAILSIQRAGDPMSKGFRKVFTNTPTYQISASRGEQTGPESFEISLTGDLDKSGLICRDVIVVDPMLATGSTLEAVLKELHESASPHRVFSSHVVSHALGVRRTLKYLDALYTLTVDPVLDEKGYIIPGLGDAGDRAYGTPH